MKNKNITYKLTGQIKYRWNGDFKYIWSIDRSNQMVNLSAFEKVK